MKKQPAERSRKRTRGILLGVIAVGVALTSGFALTGGTPSSAYEAVFATSSTDSTTRTVETAETVETPLPAASKDAGSAADPKAAEVKAPEVSEAVGVAPAKPQANDEELGRTPQKKNKPVKLAETVQVLDGVTVGITNLAAVQGVADEPGEVAGDAVKVSVTLTNTGSTTADTSGVVVELAAGPNSTPGLALSGTGTTAFPPSIAPGASATADYIFVVDANQRARVSISVNYSVTSPIAVFDGVAPPAKGKQ